jgi:hypothetical protein
LNLSGELTWSFVFGLVYLLKNYSMRNFLKGLVLLLLPALIHAQSGIVNNGGKIKVMATANIKMNNSGLTNKNNGEITNSGNMYLDNDWTQTGATTTYGGVGWMWFEGTTNQNISSVSAINVPRLRVDNGNILLLGSDVTVSTQVDFMTNGNIQLGTNNLLMSPTATMVNYDANNRVITDNIGFLQREVSGTAVFFPVGNASYNPLTLTNTGTTDNFQLRVEDQVWTYGTTGVLETNSIVNRTWHLDEETVGGSVADITVQWEQGEELTTFNRTMCAVSHWNGAAWDHTMPYLAATNVGGTNWVQTRNGQTTFSPFAVEDLEMNLPVELLTFDANRLDLIQVELDWSTASETNNQGFEIERMLEHESSFQKIAWVDGHGTTTLTNYYQLMDDNNYSDVSYYRLKQIDFDGSFAYSDIRAVAGMQSKNGSELNVAIFPNPVSDVLKISFQDLPKEIESATIKIITIDGKILYQYQPALQTYLIVELDAVQDLVPAVYILSIELDNGEHIKKKFVKTSD